MNQPIHIHPRFSAYRISPYTQRRQYRRSVSLLLALEALVSVIIGISVLIGVAALLLML